MDVTVFTTRLDECFEAFSSEPSGLPTIDEEQAGRHLPRQSGGAAVETRDLHRGAGLRGLFGQEAGPVYVGRENVVIEPNTHGPSFLDFLVDSVTPTQIGRDFTASLISYDGRCRRVECQPCEADADSTEVRVPC